MNLSPSHNVVALIPAAGEGKRLQPVLDEPKQFTRLGGKPLLAHTLEAFQRCDILDRIIIPAHPDYIPRIWQEIVNPFELNKVTDVIPGGATRQDSVWLGMALLRDQAPEIIIVHDAVRPFITSGTIEESVSAAQKHGGCVVGMPVIDTVKRVEQDIIQSTENRENLWAAHTPQTFRYMLLLRACERAREDGFTGTDESMLVERLGVPVKIIRSHSLNFKITTPMDLVLAKLMLRDQQQETTG